MLPRAFRDLKSIEFGSPTVSSSKTLLIMLATVALASPAFAQSPIPSTERPAAVAGMEDAARQFQVYIDGVAKAGGRPDFSKPPASDLFAKIYDQKQIAALPPPQAGDVPWLLDWLGATNTAAKAVYYFGTTPVYPPTAEEMTVVKRNVSDYEQQEAISVAFSIRLSARMAPSLTLFMNGLTPALRTPIREAGLERTQKSAVEMLYGALVTIAQGMKPANARLLSGAMSDTRDVWAGFIPAQYRPQILAQLAQAQKADADDRVQDDLATFGAALASAKDKP